MSDFIAALGLVFVIEGLIYGAFPGLAKRLAVEVLGTSEGVLRAGGLVAIALGVAVVWMARG